MRTVFWRGRLHFAVPPRLETPWSAVIRRLEQARACKVASVVLGPPPRRARAPAWRPRIVHATPASTPRPREHRAAPRGRDGTERDDGSGSDDGGGRR